MALIKEWSSTGSAVTDEFVRCDESCTVGGETYYRGFLNYIPNDSIEGDDSSSYGIYSAASIGDNQSINA